MVMSNYTTFPDAIVFPDGTIRLVTDSAKHWAYSNTDIKDRCTVCAVPDYVDFEDSIPQMMENVGLVIRWERQPVGHYRSKRRTSLKAKTSDDPDDYHDSHRARFVGMTLKQYRAQQGYIDCRRQNHRKMQEAAESHERDEHPELDEGA
jgi:hypothetical protein